VDGDVVSIVEVRLFSYKRLDIGFQSFLYKVPEPIFGTRRSAESLPII
jgi:hypothetical protein